MRSRTLAGVVAGIAILALGAGAATTASPAPAAPPGITILPDLPEPGEAQFVPGQSHYVPPTAPPAQDVGMNAVQTLAVPFYACPGFSGLDRQNPLANLYKDVFTWAPYAPYQVGNSGGNINWSLNPYKNASWYMWFHSLRWLGQGCRASNASRSPAPGPAPPTEDAARQTIRFGRRGGASVTPAGAGRLDQTG